jgi:hypothetical protein
MAGGPPARGGTCATFADNGAQPARYVSVIRSGAGEPNRDARSRGRLVSGLP